MCVCVCVCMYVLKAEKMNVQDGLIRELILSFSELGHNAAEATKTFCVRKVKAKLIYIYIY